MAGSTKVVLVLAVGVLTVVGAYFAFIPDRQANPEFVVGESGDNADPGTVGASGPDDGDASPAPPPRRGAARDRAGSGRTLGDSAREAMDGGRGAVIPESPHNNAGASDASSFDASRSTADDLARENGWDASPGDVGPPASVGHANGFSDGGKDIPSSPATQRDAVDPPALPREIVQPNLVPIQSPTPNAPAAVPGADVYIVKEGDTLSAIAQWWFGDATRWDLIQDANPGLKPERMQIGQKLKLPARTAGRAAAASTPGSAATSPAVGSAAVPGAAGRNTYVVRSGDTLTTIARARYGSVAKWRAIYEANRALIGPNPDELEVGMVLTLPN
jgi:LysM repeat protein